MTPTRDRRNRRKTRTSRTLLGSSRALLASTGTLVLLIVLPCASAGAVDSGASSASPAAAESGAVSERFRRCPPPTTRCATYAQLPPPGMQAAWRCSWCRGRRRRARTPIRWGSRAALRSASKAAGSLQAAHGRRRLLRPASRGSAQHLPATHHVLLRADDRDRRRIQRSQRRSRLESLRQRIWLVRTPFMHRRRDERLLRAGQPERRYRQPALSRKQRSKKSRRSDLRNRRERKDQEAACKEVEEADGWATEISLDIEVSHAVCQNCKIVLVEADSASFFDLEDSRGHGRLGSPPRRSRTPGAAPNAREGLSAPNVAKTAKPSTTMASSSRRPPATTATWIGTPKKARKRASPTIPPPPRTWSRWAAPACVPLGAGGTWAGETVWNGKGAGGSGCSISFAAPEWQTAEPDWSSLGCGSQTSRRRCLRRRRPLHRRGDLRLDSRKPRKLRRSRLDDDRRHQPRLAAGRVGIRARRGRRWRRIPRTDPVRKRARATRLTARCHFRIQRGMLETLHQ